MEPPCDNLRGKRILVTGVAGFIGSNLADYLLEQSDRHGWDLEVRGIDNLAYGVRDQVPAKVQFEQLDVRSGDLAAAFEDVDFVFHLAAKNCLSDCQEDPVQTADTNVTGTVNVLRAAVQQGVSKVVHAESSALYEGCERLPTDESETRPQSFYAVSKAAAGAFAQAFSRFHGLRQTGLRYFCVYGPRQDYRRTIPPVMSAFIIRLLQGQAPIIYGTGDKRRDFVHVRDINRFHLQCLTDPRTDGQVFNLGSGANHSVRELYERISDLLDIHIPCDQRPDLPGEAQETLADITRAQQLDWQPEVSLDEGLREMIAYIRQEIAAGRIPA